MQEVPLKDADVRTLRRAAKEVGVDGYSRMPQEKLVEALHSQGYKFLEIEAEGEVLVEEENSPQEPTVVSSKEDLNKFHVEQLQEFALEFEIDPEGMNKAKLVNALWEVLDEEGPEEEEGPIQEEMAEAEVEPEVEATVDVPQASDPGKITKTSLHKMKKKDLLALAEDYSIEIPERTVRGTITPVGTIRGILSDQLFGSEPEEEIVPEPEPEEEEEEEKGDDPSPAQTQVQITEFSEDEILAMELRELRELIEEYDLPVRKSGTDTQIAQAIIDFINAPPEQEPEEEEDPEEEGEEEETPAGIVLTPGVLQAMGRLELLEVAEELGIDPPASTTKLRSLVNAAVEALEKEPEPEPEPEPQEEEESGIESEGEKSVFPKGSHKNLLLDQIQDSGDEGILETDLIQRCVEILTQDLHTQLATDLQRLLQKTKPTLARHGISLIAEEMEEGEFAGEKIYVVVPLEGEDPEPFPLESPDGESSEESKSNEEPVSPDPPQPHRQPKRQ